MDILELNPHEVPEIREIPEGKYSGNVVDYVIKENTNGTQYVQFSFRVTEALSGQDMTGVQTNLRVFSKRIFLTEKSLPLAAKELIKFGVPKADSFRTWIEAVPGTSVVFDVAIEKSKTSGREFRTVVDWQAA